MRISGAVFLPLIRDIIALRFAAVNTSAIALPTNSSFSAFLRGCGQFGARKKPQHSGDQVFSSHENVTICFITGPKKAHAPFATGAGFVELSQMKM